MQVVDGNTPYRTGINLIIAFSIAVKHKLRFEPDVAYDDLQGLVGYLDTFAKTAHASDDLKLSKKSSWKAAGEYLGVSFAESNPRKVLKRAKKPLGNLPLEIIVYLSAYLDKLINNEMVPIPAHQSDVGKLQAAVFTCGSHSNKIVSIVASINAMNDVLAGTERVLNTPLPLAYRIAISQITWIYVLVLPFQLHGELFWFTIPGTISMIPQWHYLFLIHSLDAQNNLLTTRSKKNSRYIYHPRNRAYRT